MTQIKSNIPKIRFKEFSGEWEINKEKIKILSGNTYSLNDYQKNGTLLIQGLNINAGKLDIDKPIYISNDNKENHVVIKENDILLALNRPITNNKLKTCLFNQDKAYLYQRAGILNFDMKYIDNMFLYQYISSVNFMKKLSLELVGSDQPYIKSDLFQKTKNIFPELPEQQKISSFLSSVDEKIENIKEKKKSLEEYKKGVMQKIFSREIRFKDENGEEFGEWEEDKLGKIGEIVTGKTPSTSNKDLWNGDIQFITPTDINDGDKYQFKTNRYVQNTGKLKILPSGSIIYTCIASIGKMSLSIKPSITNQQINSIIPFDDVHNEYLYYYLLYLTPKIKSVQANTTLPIINKTDFSKFKILIPSLPEQQKIADFLSGIDEKIEKVIEELGRVEEFKKGLLQGMFV